MKDDIPTVSEIRSAILEQSGALLDYLLHTPVNELLAAMAVILVFALPVVIAMGWHGAVTKRLRDRNSGGELPPR